MSNLPTLIALTMATAGAGAALSPAPVGMEFGTEAMKPASAHIAPAAKMAGVMVIDRDSDGFFYMPATINGSPVRFLIDTGASMVILPTSVAAQAGITGKSRVMASTVGGQQSVELSSIQSLTAAEITLENVPVAIQPTEMAIPLLGVDTFSKIGRIEIDGDQITITPKRRSESR
jgi:clan AA aspartic protease (TIGR02281 family)